jgi:hypothetical protein
MVVRPIITYTLIFWKHKAEQTTAAAELQGTMSQSHHRSNEKSSYYNLRSSAGLSSSTNLGWTDRFWTVEMKSPARGPLFGPIVGTIEEGRGFSRKVKESN